MGILRTDIISHSQLEGSGSVEFDGDGDSLTFTTTGGLSLDTDFTIEFYIYNNTIALDTQHPSPITMPTDGSAMSQIYTNSSGNYYGLYKSGDIVTTGNNSALTGVWQHVAFTRKGSICFAFLDGVLKNTAVSTVTFGGTSGTYRLGSYTGSGGDVNGFISNLRIIKRAIYTANFTVPKFELKNIAGTTLLGCQSTTSATDFAVTPNTITANNDAAASSFHPSLKKDITDTGVVFDGVTTFDSLAYMVPPSGKTSERNRGRGLFAGGDAPIGFDISSIEIQSQGNAADFGDLTSGRLGAGAVGSSTRGVISSGYTQPSNDNINIIDFVTIANRSNATDFGDSTQARHESGASSSQTRGLFGGGTSPSLVDTIDFVTIATAGNATDFGNLTVSRRNVTGVSSPTRSVFLGGRTSGDTASDVLDFVTIASTGNATDFGNLTAARGRGASVCSSTRGIMCGGETPTAVNTIDFITIASAGNATDFGDCISIVSQGAGGASNKTRGAFCVGYIAPAYTNAIQFVTIATTGNSVDFGDNTVAGGRSYGFSDSHGGLS